MRSLLAPVARVARHDSSARGCGLLRASVRTSTCLRMDDEFDAVQTPRGPKYALEC